MSRSPYNFILKCIAETERAVCVTEDDEDKIWIPKSQINIEDVIEKEDGTYLLLEIPEWLASDKGLI